MLLHEHRSISVSELLLQVSVRILPGAQHYNNTMMAGYLQKFIVVLLAKKLSLFMESKRVLPYSQKHATEHYLDSAGCSPLRRPFVSHPRGLHGPKFQNYPAQPEACYPHTTEARLPFTAARIKLDLLTVCPHFRVTNTYFSQCMDTNNA